MIRSKKIIFLALIIAGIIIFFSRCLSSENRHDPRGEAYAGSASCITCHQNIYQSYLHTAHYQSASPASSASITGSFSTGSNTFIVNDSVKIVMEKRNNVFYQVMYIHNKESEAHRFDIVFGSVKGQSYLYWKNDLLFQMPISYFSALQSWTSSPGYTSGTINFTRPVNLGCFECHSSYIAAASSHVPVKQNANAFDKSTLIYNIDCERCHGPAATHVNFHTAYPEQTKARYIVSFNSLSRTQKIAMCAVCHSGTKNTVLRSTFTFKPGDSLESFMQRVYSIYDRPDVHGNQAQLLAQSKCFINSNMDCATCHNTHVKDRGNNAAYAQHCTTCHTPSDHNFCKMADSSNISFIKNNCTRCHMPTQPSSAIVVQTSTSKTNIACYIINHRIAVYPYESKKIMEAYKSQTH